MALRIRTSRDGAYTPICQTKNSPGRTPDRIAPPARPRVVSIASTNALSPERAKEGDTVEVTLEFDEDVVAPTGLIPGRAATVQGASPGARFVAPVSAVQ
mgnify:CR=1 FL=1